MAIPRRKKTREKHNGIYRSKFEADFAKTLKANKLTADYEQDKLKYEQPASTHTYTPDWTIREGIYIETKGRFTGADRKKMLWLRDSNPGVTVYMLFMRSKVTLSKASKTTYGDWCDKNNIIWADIKDTKKWKKWFK